MEGPDPQAASQLQLKLLVWNINALPPTVENIVLKYGTYKGFFDAHAVDILCLQESKVSEEKLTKELACVEGYQSFWACSKAQGKLGSSGVATYCSSAWAPVSCEIDRLGEHGIGAADACLSGEGRIIVTDHDAFVMLNVYTPNAGDASKGRPRLDFKMRFLAALRRRCDALADAGREVLLVGDLNISYDQRDVHPRLGLEESYVAEERDFMAALTERYVDVWRRLHPEAAGVYTVWHEKTSARAFNEGLRIDYVLATPGLLPKIKTCEILGADVLPPKWSDHAGITVEVIGVEPPPPHPPCAAWVQLNKRFNDPSQRSIMSMFGKKQQQGTKRAQEKAAEVELGGGGQRSIAQNAAKGEPGSKRLRKGSAPAAVAGEKGELGAGSSKEVQKQKLAGACSKGMKSFFAQTGAH